MKDGATNKSGMNTLEVAEKETAQHVVKNLDQHDETKPIVHANVSAAGDTLPNLSHKRLIQYL